MPRNIDSDALTIVQRQLGLSGIGESSTELLSDELVQSLDVTGAVRRARADIASGGWFFFVLQNVHGAADDEVSNVDPYNAGATALGTFPPTIDPRFDLWIEAVGVRRLSGAGQLLAGAAVMLLPERFMGIGIDDSGGGVAAKAVAFPIANWDSFVTEPNSTYGFSTDSGRMMNRLGFRMPRGGLLQFESESQAAMTVEAFFLVGLFPIALGSDIARW